MTPNEGNSAASASLRLFFTLHQDDQLSQSTDFASMRNYLFMVSLSQQNKTQIWQKDRTQKNESDIFLRSIFLPSTIRLVQPVLSIP